MGGMLVSLAMKGLLAVGCAAALLAAAMAAPAPAAHPVRGGHYSGRLHFRNPAPPQITFDVSADGTRVQNLRITYPPLLCALGGMTPPQKPARAARVTPAGHFARTVRFATKAGTFATIRVRGSFRAHRRVTGKARVRWIGGFEPGCGGTLRYAARA
jgi:hypothetical protein